MESTSSRSTRSALTPDAEDVASPGSEPTRLLTRQRLLVACCLFFFGLAVFLLTDVAFHIPLTSQSSTPYFTDQAASWLQGRLDLWPVPLPISDVLYPNNHTLTDLVTLHGHYYSIYGLTPALLALPFVAIFGRDTSDILLFLVVSAMNLGLLFLIFEQLARRGFTHRGWRENAIWSALLYLGGTGFYLSLGGEVWFSAHIVGVAFTLLSLLLAMSRRFVFSAIALAAAFFARTTPLLGFPFLLYLAWDHGGTPHSIGEFVRSVRARRPDWNQVPWRRLAGVVAVVIVMLGVYVFRNVAMFGSPSESGYGLLLAQDYGVLAPYGLFSIHYLKADLVNNFLNFPVVINHRFGLEPMIDMVNGGQGISVFLTTPLFLLLFWRNKERSNLRLALWITIAAMTAVTVFYFTAGYPEFGTRYLFDMYPYAWVLLLLNDVRFDWRVVALGVFAIGVNVLGARNFWTWHPVDLSHLHL